MDNRQPISYGYGNIPLNTALAPNGALINVDQGKLVSMPRNNPGVSGISSGDEMNQFYEQNAQVAKNLVRTRVGADSTAGLMAYGRQK